MAADLTSGPFSGDRRRQARPKIVVTNFAGVSRRLFDATERSFGRLIIGGRIIVVII